MVSCGEKHGLLLPVIWFALTLSIQFCGEPCAVALRYAPEPIEQGEIWRLVTGHWVHLGWVHWGMNAAAVVALWLVFGAQIAAWIWWGTALLVAVGISLGFWVWIPDLPWYVGFSGVLHAWLVLGAVLGTPLQRWVILPLVLAKLAWEQYTALLGAHPSAAWIGGEVMIEAHLWGAILGGIIAAVIALIGKRGLNEHN